MEMTSRDALKRAIASADIFALLSAAFSYPDPEFAQALLDGSFDSDITACLSELGYPAQDNKPLKTAILPDTTTDNLLDMLRKEHSRLFLLPGKYANIFPYESAFRHVASGRSGTPALFIATQTKDVERRMRTLGVLPETAHTQPVDSIHAELDFLRVLYASWANAILQDDEPAICAWEAELRDFRICHIDAWIPDLMNQVCAQTRSDIYRALASTALIALSITALPEGAE
jgi:TorA maturation chaperone TorD